MQRAVSVVAVVVILALGGLGLFTLDATAASKCAVTETISQLPNNTVVVSPAHATLTLGGCVAFSNATQGTVSVKVTRGTETLYGPATIAKGTTTTASAGFTPKTAGSNVVTATSTVVLLRFHGSAKFTVTPKPSPRPSGTATSSASHGSSKPSAKPDVAPSPKKSKKSTALPLPTGITLPPLPPLPSTGVTALPVGSNPVVASQPTTVAATASSSAPAAIVAGPIDPTDNNRRGLPEAVGVLVVLGLAIGWGRALLATPIPVDNRIVGSHRI